MSNLLYKTQAPSAGIKHHKLPIGKLGSLQIPFAPRSPTFPSYRPLDEPLDYYDAGWEGEIRVDSYGFPKKPPSSGGLFAPDEVKFTIIPEKWDIEDDWDGDGIVDFNDLVAFKYFMKRMKAEMKNKRSQNIPYSELTYFTTKDGHQYAYWDKWRIAFPRDGDKVNFKIFGAVVNDYDEDKEDYFLDVMTNKYQRREKGNAMDYEKPIGKRVDKVKPTKPTKPTKPKRPGRDKSYKARASHPEIPKKLKPIPKGFIEPMSKPIGTISPENLLALKSKRREKTKLKPLKKGFYGKLDNAIIEI